MAAILARIPVADLPDGTLRRVPRPPFHVLVARVGPLFFAIEDACPHSGWSLSEGTLELAGDGPCVTCPGHGWVVDLRDGRVRTEVGRGEANPTFRTEVVGEELLVYDEPA